MCSKCVPVLLYCSCSSGWPHLVLYIHRSCSMSMSMFLVRAHTHARSHTRRVRDKLQWGFMPLNCEWMSACFSSLYFDRLQFNFNILQCYFFFVYFVALDNISCRNFLELYATQRCILFGVMAMAIAMVVVVAVMVFTLPSRNCTQFWEGIH